MRHLITPLSLAVVFTACSIATVETTTTGTPLPRPDPVTLEPAGLGAVLLGDTPEEVIATLTPVIGSPSDDTGWTRGGDGIYGTCPDPLRVVSWGSLVTFFTGASDGETLFAYSYGFDFDEARSGIDPMGLGLTTAGGIGLDTTAEELAAVGIDIEGDPAVGVWRFALEPTSVPHLVGQLSGPEPNDTVSFIETSTGCS